MVVFLSTDVAETVEGADVSEGDQTVVDGTPTGFGFPSAGEELEIQPSGILLAAIAFASTRIFVVSGVVYSLALWVIAGGVVMAVWLNALGIPSPVPNLGLSGLVGHPAWGLVIAGSFRLLPASRPRAGGGPGIRRRSCR